MDIGPSGSLLLAGEIDMAVAPALHQALTEARVPGEQIVVDMTRVTFIDSSGLYALLRPSRREPRPAATLGVADRIAGDPISV